MKKDTDQIKFWSGDFGNAYANRTPQTLEAMDNLYMKDYGISRKELNKRFLGGLDRSIKILEVGANIGLQLEALREMGFKNLLGVEVNDYAVRQAKKLHPDFDVIRGSAFDLPFRDKYFDLVYTSGVLIHIDPKDINEALDEIWRVSKRYIWCYEYAASELTNMDYRGNKERFWKTDFLKLYTNRFPDLKILKSEAIPVLGSANFTQMFLLEKP